MIKTILTVLALCFTMSASGGPLTDNPILDHLNETNVSYLAYMEGDVLVVQIISGEIDQDNVAKLGGVTEVEKKYVRFAVTANTPFKNVRVIISLKTNNASGTAYCKIYVDSESTPRKTLNTTQTGETLVEDTFSISNLATGIHTLRFKFYNSNASYVTTSNIMEVFLEP